MAAYLPAKAPSYAAPFSWTGFYIGAHVGWGWGWGWGTVKWSDACPLDSHHACIITEPGPAGRYSLNGFLGGGQLGYNLQSGWAVFGVDADAGWTDIKGSGSCVLGRKCSSKIDALGTITGRFGGAVDHALVYLKGGGAWVHEKHTVTDGSNSVGDNDSGDVVIQYISDSSSQTRWGWTVGAGVEYAFTSHWSGKLEYNFLDFGKDTIVLPKNSFQSDLRQTIQTVKLGINYRFGGPGY
jgi:outer membrane immunogenic protein